MGGSNQSLFLIGAIVATQGTASVPLLAVGLVLSWAAAPGWTELVLMWPNRVGGIAATCAEAFRPYGPVLANLTGVCYWWGWVPTCGLTAILSASALQQWYLPHVSVGALATMIVVVFTFVNLKGIRWVTRLAVPVACGSAGLAFLSALVPVLAGTVNWHRAASISLTTPFHGLFGQLTSVMAGLYLIGFAAPAFEAAACHVGETRDPARNVPRAMFASGAMATLYFVVLPVIWLGVIGKGGIGGDLARTLGPTFAPLLGSAAKAAAIWFMMFNMFHGTLQPLAGSARTLSQLSEDGLLPRLLARRNRADVPWVATLLTAGMAVVFMQSGDPPWVIAAANLTYLIGIGLPSIAVWLLRRNAPEMERPYRAPRGTIVLGVGAAFVWLLTTIFGFQQFGLPTVLAGLALAYCGSILYAWRAWRDRVNAGGRRIKRSLHLKLTGAMLGVLAFDFAGYLLAITHVPKTDAALSTVLADIFVVVAVLTIAVGLVLPGMVAHSTRELAKATADLARGTVGDLTRAMRALSTGDLDAAHARVDSAVVAVRSQDEVGLMADSFNLIRDEVIRAARALDGAREGLRSAELKLARNLRRQASVAALGQRALETSDIPALLEEAVATLQTSLAADAALVMQRLETGGGFRLLAPARLCSAPGFAAIPDDTGELDGALAVHAPQTVTSAPRVLDPYLTAPSRSGVVKAINYNEQDACLLGVYSVRERDFTPEEIDFVHAVGNILSESIQRARTLEEISHQAHHDMLTALPNRALFVEQLSVALAHSVRRETKVGVFFVDLDHFKLINDSLGHSAGDEVLRQTAVRLSESLRPGDTVARFGGDEFVMACVDLRDPDEAVGIAARIAQALRAPLQLGEMECRLTASIGIAVGSGLARSAEDLIGEADAAMYRAKERGRNGYETFDEDMRSQTADRLQVAGELAHALERGELHVEYQPIVALDTGAVRSAEALARWTHPARGRVSPELFISIAEESGMIVSIGEFVLREACAAAKSWHEERPELVPTPVSVNVSLHQVRAGNLAETVASVLFETGLDASLLHLEITESVLMDETESSMRCLHALKSLGVSLMLDDFGTGYSSLSYVQRFPVDVIKIDRSFVADLGRDNRGSAIVGAIIEMARGLQLDVVAEGVETAAQAEMLLAMNCRLAQGWLFAPALPSTELMELLGRPLAPDLVTSGLQRSP